MNVREAYEKITLLLRHDWYATEIKAILEDLELCAYERGQEAFDATLHQRETSVTA